VSSCLKIGSDWTPFSRCVSHPTKRASHILTTAPFLNYIWLADWS